MHAEVLVNKFNGNVLVAKGGTIIYQKAFGSRNYDTKESLDNNSVFELASISKQFTAMGILLLIEKEKLKFSDTLRKFFPQLPYQDITIQHLLTHTSGLPDYMQAMATKWDHKRVAFNDDVINFLAAERLPPNFKPGARWEYSNTGYQMLASIIEKVSGQTLKQYMQQNIFSPLKMNHTRVYNTRRSTNEAIPNYAFGYTYSDSLKQYMLPDSLPALDFVYYLDGIQGDGIVNSTTGDLLKWDRALKNNILLSKVAQKEMFSPQALMDTFAKTYYGYGVAVGKNELGNFITHSGGWPGYFTNLVRYLDDDVTIIVLSNNESNAIGLSGALTYITYEKPVILPYVHKEVIIDGAILDRYVGKYGIPQEIELIKKEGKLYRRLKGRPDVELKPESERKFFYSNNPNDQLEFEVDATGKVLKTYLVTYGIKKEIVRY
jgi:CubicO group peptidase (beta-lactamase class C family)